MRFLLLLLLALPPTLHGATDNIWSIVHFSDCHAGLTSHGTHRTNAETFMSWIYARTNDGVWNIRGLISTGDVYQQQTSYDVGGIFYTDYKWQWTELTNAFNQLRTNGLFVWLCDGNHDADNFNDRYWDNSIGYSGLNGSDVAKAWTNAFPLGFFTNQLGFVSNYFAGTSTPNESKMCAMSYTNGDIKLLWIPISCAFTQNVGGVKYSIRDGTAPMMQWATNLANSRPDHNVILGAHFLLSWTPEIGQPHFRDDYGEGSQIYQYLAHGKAPFEVGGLQITNTLMWLSGHTRSLYSGHVTLRDVSGHPFDVQCFNAQNMLGHASGYWNGRYARILTFNARTKTVWMRTWDVLLDVEVTSLTREIGSQTFSYPTQWKIPLSIPRQKRIIKQ